MDKVHKFYTEDLMLRVSSAITTQTLAEICGRQSILALASMALGRAMTGAILMASQLREGQRVGVHFNGDGPVGFLFAEANYEGEARGYCGNAQAALPLKDGKLDVAGGIGRGILTVTRSQPFEKEPHRGIVPIVSGEVSQDLAYYLFQSHQVPSIISLAVSLDARGEVLAAGGVLIEVMPGADELLLSELEARSKQAPPLSQILAEGASPNEMAGMYVHKTRLLSPEPPRDVKFVCKCSIERVERTLTLCGKSTLAEMILKGQPTHVTCQFCGKSYTVTIARLRELADALDK